MCIYLGTIWDYVIHFLLCAAAVKLRGFPPTPLDPTSHKGCLLALSSISSLPPHNAPQKWKIKEERTSQLFRRPHTTTSLFDSAALTFVPKLGFFRRMARQFCWLSLQGKSKARLPRFYLHFCWDVVVVVVHNMPAGSFTVLIII
jgi:hypothetical protein